MASDPRIEAGTRAIYEMAAKGVVGARGWEDVHDDEREATRDDLRVALEAADAADPLRAGAKPCECCGETLPGSTATDEHVHMCWQCQATLLGAMVEALLDRDRMVPIIEGVLRDRWPLKAGAAWVPRLAAAVFDAIKEASDGS